jgi:hypothetical protein
MINQAPIVRYTAFVSEIFFSDFRKKTFSAESLDKSDPILPNPPAGADFQSRFHKSTAQAQEMKEGALRVLYSSQGS